MGRGNSGNSSAFGTQSVLPLPWPRAHPASPPGPAEPSPGKGREGNSPEGGEANRQPRHWETQTPPRGPGPPHRPPAGSSMLCRSTQVFALLKKNPKTLSKNTTNPHNPSHPSPLGRPPSLRTRPPPGAAFPLTVAPSLSRSVPPPPPAFTDSPPNTLRGRPPHLRLPSGHPPAPVPAQPHCRDHRTAGCAAAGPPVAAEAAGPGPTPAHGASTHLLRRPRQKERVVAGRGWR